jgi:hypothetical protein
MGHFDSEPGLRIGTEADLSLKASRRSSNLSFNIRNKRDRSRRRKCTSEFHNLILFTTL